MITANTPIDSPELEAEARRQLKEESPLFTDTDLDLLWGARANSILAKLRGDAPDSGT